MGLQEGLRGFAVVTLLGMGSIAWADGADARYPEGSATPRDLTAEEQRLIETAPIVAARGGGAPTGPVTCPPEYAPCDGLLFAYEGSGSWLDIVDAMCAQVTTVGNAKAYVVVDTASEQTSAASFISAAGANMANVEFIVRTTDTIWIRDYGPRFIYEGGVRAIVDHTYNRPRPNDNALSSYFGPLKNHEVYTIPLVHGGGNYHLSGTGDSFSTQLIANENPSLSSAQIITYWQDYQNLLTTITSAFPTSVDSTQHIDMWMIALSDTSFMISDWPLASGSTQDIICDGVATDLANAGYTVVRVPAVNTGGTHYTFTNAVICNDLVLMPTYTNATASAYNVTAHNTWAAALPSHTIVDIPCQAIVTAAGVMHCIVMHVPENSGGVNPVAYLRTPNGGGSYNPSDSVSIVWTTDDDEAVSNVDIDLSVDGGANWSPVAAGIPDTGSYNWIVPDVFATDARIRVTARDALGNMGADLSDSGFAINGAAPCPGDSNGDLVVDLADISEVLFNFGTPGPGGDVNGDNMVDLADLSEVLFNFGNAC
ncbi:MAG: agmatine deiminase family protein [Phycisphaerales bacterium]|nr:agmatine deiminase family protein [Phycisphaerales bacterium]